MSETGRKLDVEDVLSSIRRLVSEEARGESSASGDGVTSDEPFVAPEPDKLVLTPSLRVPESDRPVPTAEIEQRISDIEDLVKSDTRATETSIPPMTDTAEMIASAALSAAVTGLSSSLV